MSQLVLQQIKSIENKLKVKEIYIVNKQLFLNFYGCVIYFHTYFCGDVPFFYSTLIFTTHSLQVVIVK